MEHRVADDQQLSKAFLLCMDSRKPGEHWML